MSTEQSTALEIKRAFIFPDKVHPNGMRSAATARERLRGASHAQSGAAGHDRRGVI
jgi:hypothetical protein